MDKFIDLIKKHKPIAIAGAVVLLLIIAAAIVLLALSDGSDSDKENNKQEFFTDTNNPVYVYDSENGIEIDITGYKSSDLKWAVDPEFNSVFETKCDDKDKKDLNIVILPAGEGYGNIKFTQSGEIAGLSFTAVQIEANVMVNYDENGGLVCSLSDIHQELSYAGALDSETPYILSGNKVLMPKGGDWTLTPEYSDKAFEGMYEVYEGSTDDNIYYIAVEVDISKISSVENENNSKLILSSETLDFKKELVCLLGADGDWKLSEVTADNG